MKAFFIGDNGINLFVPKVASCFYALDRYASFMQRDWGKTYRDGGNILFARYLSSNILHQASKYDSWEEVKEFIDWLYDFECNLLGIPRDDCVILLNMPPEKALELIKDRENKNINKTRLITDWEEVIQLVQDDIIPNARVEHTWIFRKPFLVFPNLKYCCDFSCSQKAFKSLELRVMRKPFKGSLSLLEKQLDAEVYCEYLRDREIPIVRG